MEAEQLADRIIELENVLVEAMLWLQSENLLAPVWYKRADDLLKRRPSYAARA